MINDFKQRVIKEFSLVLVPTNFKSGKKPWHGYQHASIRIPYKIRKGHVLDRSLICKHTTGFGVYMIIINQKLNHIETGMHPSPGCNYPVCLLMGVLTDHSP